MEDVLAHYGILGMHWGIRRTPEELGHRKAAAGRNKLQKYKDKKIKTVDKMYAKAIKSIENGLEYDPGNKELTRQLKELNKLKSQDIDKVNKMTYTDVVREQKEISAARKEKAVKVAGTVAKTTMTTSLWALKMGLTGVRIYGTFKAAQMVGELGMQAYDWLQSPEGQAFLNKGFNTVNTFVGLGDKAAKLVNPDLGDYLDSEKVAKMVTTEAKNQIRNNFGNEIDSLTRTVDQATAAAEKATEQLDQLERRVKR